MYHKRLSRIQARPAALPDQTGACKRSFLYRAELLMAADCTACACADMDEDFMRGKRILTGCPRLDAGDHT